MDLILILFIVVISVVLFASAAAVVIKLFGTGIFYGLDVTCTFVMEETDSVQEKLMQITEALGTECEYSGAKILIIDGGLNRGQREICRMHCERYGYFLFSSPDNASNVFFALKKEKDV